MSQDEDDIFGPDCGGEPTPIPASTWTRPTVGRSEEEILRQAGEAIRACRQARCMSQQELANLVKLSRQTIISAERGQTNIKILDWVRIFDALDVTWTPQFGPSHKPPGGDDNAG